MTLRPIDFRSCRDTGITWLALTGLPIQAMLKRVGHDGPETTLGYVKMAEDLRGRVGQPFPPLPPSPVGGRKRHESSQTTKNRRKRVPEEGIEPEGSLPTEPRENKGERPVLAPEEGAGNVPFEAGRDVSGRSQHLLGTQRGHGGRAPPQARRRDPCGGLGGREDRPR